MERVDVNVPKFNQAIVAALTGAAFVLQAGWLVFGTFVVLAVSAVGGPRLAPFSRLFSTVIRPRLMRERAVVTEPAGPPRFAQTLGTVVLGVAAAALADGMPVVGWLLTLTVTALAAVAVIADVCVGCLLWEG